MTISKQYFVTLDTVVTIVKFGVHTHSSFGGCTIYLQLIRTIINSHENLSDFALLLLKWNYS